MVVEYFNALREGEVQVYWQLPSEARASRGRSGYNDHVIGSSYLSPTARPVVLQKPPVARPLANTTAVIKPAPAVKPAPIAKDTLEKYIPKNILFVQSKPIMLPESEPELDRLAGFLVRNSKYRLRIDGHTDHVGNSEKNMVLSKERAQTVAAYLTKKGVSAGRITATGYGDTRPLVVELPDTPNARNRRVEFVIQE